MASGDLINNTSLGKFDQGMMLTQYLVNNGIDNLWCQHGNADDSVISTFSISVDAYGSINNATLASPRIILQPHWDTMGLFNSETVVFQMRFDSGSFRVKRDNTANSVMTNYDMTGWKIAYQTTLGPWHMDSNSAQYQQIKAQLPASNAGNYSISSLSLQLRAATDVDFYSKPILAFSNFGSSDDLMTGNPQAMKGLGALIGQKMLDLWNRNLLIGGYQALSSSPGSIPPTQHPPTFVPTDQKLQAYPWTGPAPLSQPSWGLQGSERMNVLCFLEMTNNDQMPQQQDSNIPVKGNWTQTLPPMLATATPLSRNGWTATADSAEPGFDASSVLDGNTSTYWHTKYTGTVDPLPHSLTVDMKATRLVTGLTYLPRQDATLNGTFGKYAVFLSLDGNNWGTAVAKGYFNNDNTLKQAFFTSTPARFVRLTSYSESQAGGFQWSSASEVNVLTNAIPRDNWEISADSAEPTFEGSKAIDGDTVSYWHTEYSKNLPALPHTFKINRSKVLAAGADPNGSFNPPVSGLSYIPRQDASANGRIGAYRIEQSFGNDVWSTVAAGSWADDSLPKTASFAPTTARWFRLIALSEAGNRGPWSSASEINLLDGSSQASNQASTDYGTFVMSRQNFWDNYLLPKLRTLNAALESHCNPVDVTCSEGSDIFHAKVTWDYPMLGIGFNEKHGDPKTDTFFDFKPLPLQSKNKWAFSSSYPDNSKINDHDWYSTVTIDGSFSCSNTSSIIYTPGASRITINGSSSVYMYLKTSSANFKVFSLGNTEETCHYNVSWTIVLDLVAVSDGGLAINLGLSGPTINKDHNGGSRLQPWVDYLDISYNTAVKNFGDLEQRLQQDLAGQQKFYFPAAGSFFFKNPLFNANGDLCCSVAYNGNDGSNPANLPDRRNIGVAPTPGQPSKPSGGSAS